MPRIFAPGSEKPYELHSLKQAAFVLKELDSGTSMDALIRMFRGDEWTINFWVYFLKKYGWIERQNPGGWKMTEKGKIWLEKCEMSGLSLGNPLE